MEKTAPANPINFETERKKNPTSNSVELVIQQEGKKTDEYRAKQ